MRLAYIQVGGGADGAAGAAPSPSALRASGAEAKRTPERTNQRKTDRKARRARSRPAEPLGAGFAFSRRAWLSFTVSARYCFVRYRVARYVTFGSRAITSGLTCPIYSPSIQQPKLSKRRIFLSSSP